MLRLLRSSWQHFVVAQQATDNGLKTAASAAMAIFHDHLQVLVRPLIAVFFTEKKGDGCHPVGKMQAVPAILSQSDA
jgi:hypothetical protein